MSTFVPQLGTKADKW